MSWKWVFEITEGFDGKFTAYRTLQDRPRGWFPSAISAPPPTVMGPYDTEAEAQKALDFLKTGPRVVVREESAAI